MACSGTDSTVALLPLAPPPPTPPPVPCLPPPISTRTSPLPPGRPPCLLQVPSRPVHKQWFAQRSPVITPRQSAAIVEAMQELGFLDSKGYLKDDPRVGQAVSGLGAGCWVDPPCRCPRRCLPLLPAAVVPRPHSQPGRPQLLNQTSLLLLRLPVPAAWLLQIPGSPLKNWNERLVKKLPWLHMDPKKPPMLSVLSDRSTIFEGTQWGQPPAGSVVAGPAPSRPRCCTAV